ncbi:hypothetical protein AAMO2058_001178600 [Amorphochlora amoebiformis]
MRAVLFLAATLSPPPLALMRRYILSKISHRLYKTRGVRWGLSGGGGKTFVSRRETLSRVCCGVGHSDDIEDAEELAAFKASLDSNDYCTQLERKVLDLRFGLLDGQKRDTARVAEILQLSETRVHQLTREASRKIPIMGSDGPVNITYEDSDILSISKPPGVRSQPIHRFKGDSLVQRLVRLQGSAPLVVHRLDMQTSGVMLFAKHPKAAQSLVNQFQTRLVKKQYLLLTKGIPNATHFTVDVGIGQHPHEKVKRMATPDGLPACTHFEVLASNTKENWLRINNHNEFSESPGYPCGFQEFSKTFPKEGVSLLLASPESGRTHQIRLHSAYMGLPILGDDLYGPEGPWIKRLALHAHTISFSHPKHYVLPPTPTKKNREKRIGEEGMEEFRGERNMILVAEMPDDMLQACGWLGLDVPESPQEKFSI